MTADPLLKIETEHSSPLVACAFRLGVWAATAVPGALDQWTVTHVPTGRGVPWELTREQAIVTCVLVARRYPRIGARQKPRSKRAPKGWPPVAKFLSRTLREVTS